MENSESLVVSSKKVGEEVNPDKIVSRTECRAMSQYKD
jgi:hypothetical protein